MAVQLKKRQAETARHLFSALPKYFEPSDNGLKITANGGDAVRSSISECLVCPNDITRYEFNSCIRDSLRISLISGHDFENFLSEAEYNLNEFRRQPLKKYTCWTRISSEKFRKKEINFFGQKISIGYSPPLISKWSDIARENGEVDEMPPGEFLKTSGNFRTIFSAGSSLSTWLERFSAFTNVANNSWSGFIFPPQSRAYFQVGPTFYIFDHDSSLYLDEYWINAAYNKNRWKSPREYENKFYKSLKLLRKLNISKKNIFKDDILFCCEYLNSSWMQRLPQLSVMHLWSCFERIFQNQDDGGKTQYEAICRRASKFDQDSVTRFAIMMNLASYRNIAAHNIGKQAVEVLGIEFCDESTKYLMWMINWIINFGNKFSNKKEFLDWVDIPKEKEKIIYQHKLHKLALTFWHK